MSKNVEYTHNIWYEKENSLTKEIRFIPKKRVSMDETEARVFFTWNIYFMRDPHFHLDSTYSESTFITLWRE